MKLIQVLILIICSTQCVAQILIPYLGKNGLTGFADVNGKVVIQPKYTEVNECFDPYLPAFQAKKDGQPVWVFQNGMEIPNSYSQAQRFPWNHANLDISMPADTLKHLGMVYDAEQQIFINLRTGKQVVCTYDTRKNSVIPWFQMVELPHPRHGGYAGHFFDGLMLVGRLNGLVNYMDTSLNFVFEKDYAGMIAVGNAFIVENSEHKTAIADRKGNFLSPFKFNKLVPTGREGYYVSDPILLGFERSEGVKAGVVNSKGEYVIPAKYEDVRSAGERFLIVKTSEGEGVIDFESNIVLPPMPGKLKFATDELFIHEQDKRQQIIKANGELFIADAFSSISWVNKPGGLPPHFIFSDKHISGAFAPDGRLIFRDSARHVRTLKWDGKTYFETQRTVGDKSLYGMMDFDGRELLPRQYEQIEPRISDDYLFVKKQGLAGFLDENFLPVLQLQFEELKAFNSYKGVELFGRMPAQHIWQAYDGEGKRMPEMDCLHPNFARKDFVYVPNITNKPTTIFTKENGEMPLPIELRAWKDFEVKAVETPVGLLILAYSNSDKQVRFYDKNMKPILPDGFEFPYEEINHNFVKNLNLTGLVVAFQKRDSLFKEHVHIESPPTKVDEKVKQAPQDISIEEEFVVKNDRPKSKPKLKEPPYMGSGVLNAKGEWVIKPTEGAAFQPISWNLVMEYPYGINKTFIPSRMHMVNHLKPDVFSISSADWYYGCLDKADNFRVFQTLDRNTANQRTVHTWFTYSGEQLAHFQFTEGPTYLKSRNAVRKEENGKPIWLIVDNRCRTIETLNDIDDSKARRRKPDFGKGHLVYSRNGLDGLVDSTGKQVLPFRFNELSIDANGKFLHEFAPNSNGKSHQLLDWKGNVLYESDSYIRTTIDKQTGVILIGLNMNDKDSFRNASVILLSTDGKEIGVVYGHYPTLVSMPNKQTGFYKFKSAEGKDFWVDITRGLEFREQ
ncbi:MAG: WG repeat-containing protein [Saprospiraceae bacterium]|nr:WG repeat-containing protein [Saprospiraceae bacterium]